MNKEDYIGIINVQWFDNPGAVLLCYALQKQISELGYESIVIDYASGGGVVKNNIDILGKIQNKIWKTKIVEKKLLFFELKKRKLNYEKFRNLYLKRTERFTDVNNSNLYGYKKYVVGSDVVWKPEMLQSENAAKVYFLNFLKKDEYRKKIAFAASMGTSDQNKINLYCEEYKRRLEDFRWISVREKKTAEYLKGLLCKDVTCLLDPVFLLKKEEYFKLIDHSLKRRKRYIYFYMLGRNDEALSFVEKLSEYTGIEIVYDIHDKDNLFLIKRLKKYGKPVVSDGPAQFLSEIYYADCVVTNSFHGTAFSIIFEKTFYTFSCVNGETNVSLRMENLLNSFSLMNRYNVETVNNIEKIDYRFARKEIEKNKESAIEFLQNALKS